MLAISPDNAPLAGLPLVATAGCGHGSRRWDDDRENGLKRSHGYKVGDDDSGWGAAEGGRSEGEARLKPYIDIVVSIKAESMTKFNNLL